MLCIASSQQSKCFENNRFIDVPAAEMTVAEVLLEEGIHHVWHENPTVNFMIWTSAIAEWVSHGTIAGSRTAPINGVNI